MPLLKLTSSEAHRNLKLNKQARWPDGRKSSGGRLGTHAEVGMTPSFSFIPGESIFTIGSCFAREIEKQLIELGFSVPMASVNIPPEERVSATANDILNKYIPHAMVNDLRWALDPELAFPTLAFLDLGAGQWHDPHLAANIKPASLARVKERRAHVMDKYQSVRNCRVVVITLGLAEGWFDSETQLYLNGAPPAAAFSLYPDRFELHVLSYADVLAALHDIHVTLSKWGHPQFRILLTVSPVPFKATFTMSDAMAANTYSKAVLRAAAEEFVRAHENVDYFPSYEIVTLGERSLNYEVDNIHVRRSVVARIMSQVVRHYSPSTASTGVGDHVGVDIEKPTDGSPITLFEYAKKLAGARDYVSAANVMRNLGETFGAAGCGLSAADYHLTLGVWLLRARQTVAGEIEVAKAVALDPTSSRAAYKHGLALARLRREGEASTAFETAIALDPENAAYHWRLGMLRIAQRKKPEALALLERALALDPASEPAKAGYLKAQAMG